MLRSSGGLTSSKTSVPRGIVTVSPAAGTLPEGHAEASDHFTIRVIAAGAAAFIAMLACSSLPCAAAPVPIASSKAAATRCVLWFRRNCLRMTGIFLPGDDETLIFSFAADYETSDLLCQAVERQRRKKS